MGDGWERPEGFLPGPPRVHGPYDSGAETYKTHFLHPTPCDGNNTRGLHVQCLPEEL